MKEKNVKNGVPKLIVNNKKKFAVQVINRLVR